MTSMLRPGGARKQRCRRDANGVRQEGSPYHQSFLVIHAASRRRRDTRAGGHGEALVRDANPDARVIITAAPG